MNRISIPHFTTFFDISLSAPRASLQSNSNNKEWLVSMQASQTLGISKTYLGWPYHMHQCVIRCPWDIAEGTRCRRVCLWLFPYREVITLRDRAFGFRGRFSTSGRALQANLTSENWFPKENNNSTLSNFLDYEQKPRKMISMFSLSHSFCGLVPERSARRE